MATFAGRAEVGGLVVDVAGDPRVSALKAQAAANSACPFAQNLVAEEIKGIVDSYRQSNPMKYVVIVGNDDAIERLPTHMHHARHRREGVALGDQTAGPGDAHAHSQPAKAFPAISSS